MPRKILPEGNKRRTVAFSLTKKDIEAMDSHIEKFNTGYGMDIMTRQNLMEGLLLARLYKKESRS